MTTLALNCGSSSLKAACYCTKGSSIEPQMLWRALAERLRSSDASLSIYLGEETIRIALPGAGHREALRELFKRIDVSGVRAVGHRITHGGPFFSASAVLTDEVLEKIATCVALAPLHNPVNLLGVELAQEALPTAIQVGCFDTAFHHTLPAAHREYAIPRALREKHAIRRYGFHGLSHQTVWRQAAEMLPDFLSEGSLISCHLGNGCSISAIEAGKSLDTTMGFTPLEGLVMGTRSGSIDPGALLHLMEAEKLTAGALRDLLNRQSGLLALDGNRSDMREILSAAAVGEESAIFARDVFVASLRRHLGAMIGSLRNPPRAICFTGGIGENSGEIRRRTLENFPPANVILDARQNAEIHGKGIVSAPDSTVAVIVIPADEELVIALETAAIVTALTAGVA